MYNKELKDRFVKAYDVTTMKTYLSDLKRISETEEYFKKDLFNFTYEQIDESLKGIQFKKQSSVERAVSTYRRYASWANQNGFVPSKTNLWELYTSDKLSDYVWQEALQNSFITREQLFDIIKQVSNPVDYMPILLTFEGIYGKTMSEMINLKYSDINFETGIVKLVNNDGEYRSILIEDKRTLDLIKDADKELYYLKDNGMAEGILSEASVIHTPYVIRKVTSKNPKTNTQDGIFYGNEKIGIMTIEARFSRIFRGLRNPKPEKCKAPYVTGLSFLNATNVFKSGYFDYCLKLEQRKEEELNTEDYEKACVKFGIRPVLATIYKKQYLGWKSRLNNVDRGE